ncbi:MAG: hypothetical protein AVDCRST_MAG50-584 [uncultured Acidimicrobiales bacterium]|uniref:Uncharacterized protein n=1 Tax=uncultured Acidimicrobiales bacterium TaxID=310071 RepID=A0A6J4HEL1_9ACTN|nr:MAG: hypothetical protein AVDCRST_MAG50-584 [uncultured Acidimicrobiales bacterium]
MPVVGPRPGRARSSVVYRLRTDVEEALGDMGLELPRTTPPLGPRPRKGGPTALPPGFVVRNVAPVDRRSHRRPHPRAGSRAGGGGRSAAAAPAPIDHSSGGRYAE